MRDFRTMTPSSRRSTAMSRGSHSILRKAGFSSTAAAFPLILRLPKYRSVLGLLSSLDIDRLSLFEKGPDAFAEFFQAAAQDLIAVFHRDHRLDRPGIDGHVRSHEALLTVVPANAGTHNHRPLLLRTTSAILANRNIPRYGSPLSRGRRQSMVTTAEYALPRRHADGAVEADGFAVQHRVLDDVDREIAVF